MGLYSRVCSPSLPCLVVLLKSSAFVDWCDETNTKHRFLYALDIYAFSSNILYPFLFLPLKVIHDCSSFPFNIQLRSTVDCSSLSYLKLRELISILFFFCKRNWFTHVYAVGLCCHYNAKWSFRSRRSDEAKCGWSSYWLLLLNKFQS